jgi:diguanylate cyclase (GGDEF)-like protein
VRFDLAHPTQRQVREGLISGIIAESIAVPLLVSVILLGGHQRWGYILGAIACLVVSVVYLAFFVVLTKGKAGIAAQANVGFVMVCLALSALGFLELGSASSIGTYTPAVLVGVTFVCIIGDLHMRVAIDAYAIALVAIITWIVARTVGSLNSHVNFRGAIDALNDTFEDVGPSGAETSTDIIQRVFRRGLPLVTDVMPAHRVAVYVRNARLRRFTPLAAWPVEDEVSYDLVQLPELDQALRADTVVLTDHLCAIPVGYCVDGELVMAIDRAEADPRLMHRAGEAASLLGAAFLRVSSRANFVCGLQAESRTDPLTGLANRRSLYERIEIEMAHALRNDTPLSVAMIDLDHFKQYNDRYGHVAGDTLLRSIAAVMVSNTRGQDLVARYGGEEFVLVMPDTDLVGGHHLLDQLRRGGRDTTSDFGVTLSAGLTSWDGLEDATSFIERADQALYRAKETGRDRVVSIQAFTEF